MLVSIRNLPTAMTFVNDLGSAATTAVLAYKYSTDQTLHWADPLNNETGACYHQAEMGEIPEYRSECAQNYAGPIPAAVHLHGALIPPELDGSPDSWVTSNGLRGHGYYSFAGAPSNGFTYKYPNTQEAAALIFHDHVLGNLRLNLYAGLAAAYLIEDPAIIPTNATGVWVSGVLGLNACNPASGNCLPANLPDSAEIIPVIIQDRMFDTNGQHFWPADSAGGVLWSPNPEHPYWVPEILGDTNVVNGVAWPYLEVEPRRYRFLFINATYSRIYELKLQAPMWVIGTDGGYLDAPVQIDKLPITTGERYEVIIDFAGFANQSLVLKNTGEAPYPNGTPPDPATLGRVMEFRVTCPPDKAPCSDTSYDPASGTPLRPGTQALVRLVDPAKGTLAANVKGKVAATRQLTSNDVIGSSKTVKKDPVTGKPTTYPGGRLEILTNNTKWDGGSPRTYNDFTPITLGGITNNFSEFPREGDLEVWELVNLTEVAHAWHLHGVQFQVLNRQDVNKGAYMAAYNAAFPGGGLDPTTGQPYPPGVYMPGFGPPFDYRPSAASGGKYGGNPDVTPFLQGPVRPPRPEEAGWKDTVIALPGHVTRIAVRYAPTDLPATTEAKDLYFPFDPTGNFRQLPTGEFEGYVFVHHCHMTEHEDNEMMRASQVTLNPRAPARTSRPLQRGVHY